MREVNNLRVCICTYVCMYVCMYVCRSTEEATFFRLLIREVNKSSEFFRTMEKQFVVRLNIIREGMAMVRMYVCMYVCMYVYVIVLVVAVIEVVVAVIVVVLLLLVLVVYIHTYIHT